MLSICIYWMLLYADYIVQISGWLPQNDYWILLFGNDGKTCAHKLTLTRLYWNVNVRYENFIFLSLFIYKNSSRWINMSIRNFSEKTKMSDHNSVLVRLGFEPATSLPQTCAYPIELTGRYPASGSFFLAWLLAFTKSFASLAVA